MKRTLIFIIACAALLLWTARSEAQISIQVGVGTRPYYGYYGHYYGPSYYPPAYRYAPHVHIVAPPPPRHHYYRPAPPPPPHHHRHPAPPPHHPHHR
ncbi:MAG: hypothetical protein IJF17_04675 [Thermoguttaceae bacterium]|nr:hypothetical protein [Thermoguttaceae bacterium]